MADSPLINGHRYSWASVGISLDGVETPDFTEINYKASSEKGKVRGMGRRVIGRTIGEDDCEGSFSMHKSQAAKLIKQMGHGYMHKSFNLAVSYDEDGEGGIVTDDLLGCEFTNVEDSPKGGTDAMQVKFDFHIMRLKQNGIDPHGTEDDG